MEKIARQGLLYDFYGELLTEHQKAVFEDAVLNDYSLSEIAEEYGISRQGVHDLIKRCNKILEDYESKLKLLEKFLKTKEYISQIKTIAQGCSQETAVDIDKMNRIEQLSDLILQEL